MFTGQRRWIQIIILLFTFGCSGGAAQPFATRSDLPVFPGAQGFGTTTAAGRGGRILKVTNLKEGGAGSLRAAVEASGPRIIVFEVSGRIDLASDLILSNPYCTIAGQTAPSPGVMISGRTFIIRTHDVLVQHLAIRVGDEGKTADGRWNSTDALQITGPGLYNIVVDHVSASWAIDENVGLGYGVSDVTLCNCIFAEPLFRSVNQKGPAGYSILLADDSSRISLIGNLVAHQRARAPRITAASVLLVNNVFYNKGGDDFCAVGAGVGTVKRPSYLTAVANLFLDGPSGKSGKAIAEGKIALGSAIYEQNNLYPGGVVFNGRYRASAPPENTWIEGLSYVDDLQSLPVAVMQRAGARPVERDAVDERVVRDLANGTGRIIDSQREVGGFPVIPRNYRTYEPGTNPHGDDDGDGYTNVEEILHGMAAEMEGR